MVQVIVSNSFTNSNTDTLSNKNVNMTNNTVTDTATSLGDIVHSDGTKFTRYGRGTANQILATNAAGTDIGWSTVFTKGESVQSGNAVLTAFTIAHGLGTDPSAISIDPMTSAAAATAWYTHDATNITVTFTAAPANAVNNLKWTWVAFK